MKSDSASMGRAVRVTVRRRGASDPAPLFLISEARISYLLALIALLIRCCRRRNISIRLLGVFIILKEGLVRYQNPDELIDLSWMNKIGIDAKTRCAGHHDFQALRERAWADRSHEMIHLALKQIHRRRRRFHYVRLLRKNAGGISLNSKPPAIA